MPIAVETTVTYEHRTVSANTRGLLDLGQWLAAHGCTQVAMEATGVYWKPVWHVLENTLFSLGKIAEAEAVVEQCLAENPLYLPAVIAAAEFACAKGNVKTAAEMAEKAATVASWRSAPPEGLGTLYVNLSFYYLTIDPEQSIRYAGEALKLDADDWQAHGNLGEGCRLLARKKSGEHDRKFLIRPLPAMAVGSEGVGW